MGKAVFIPLTDEILYDHPEMINGPVLPYKAGEPCYHWLSVELNPVDDVPPKTVRASQDRMPAYRQWLAALRLPLLQSLAR
jgi:hypothetical protein